MARRSPPPSLTPQWGNSRRWTPALGRPDAAAAGGRTPIVDRRPARPPVPPPARAEGGTGRGRTAVHRPGGRAEEAGQDDRGLPEGVRADGGPGQGELPADAPARPVHGGEGDRGRAAVLLRGEPRLLRQDDRADQPHRPATVGDGDASRAGEGAGEAQGDPNRPGGQARRVRGRRQGPLAVSECPQRRGRRVHHAQIPGGRAVRPGRLLAAGRRGERRGRDGPGLPPDLGDRPQDRASRPSTRTWPPRCASVSRPS